MCNREFSRRQTFARFSQRPCTMRSASVRHYYLLSAAVIACSFSMSGSLPVETQESDQDFSSNCLISNLFVAQDTENGIHVTFKNSLPDSSQQSVTLPGEHLPSVCGTHYSRCNIILLSDSTVSTQHSVLVFPVQRGVVLIAFNMINGTLQFGSYHVLELPSTQSGDLMCQVTTLFDLTDSAVRNAPNVIGLCLNEVNFRRISIWIDFNNLSSSSLSPYSYDVPVTLQSPRNLSNFVSILHKLPLCWDGLLNSLIYYFDQSNFGLFDVTGEDSYPEEYSLYYSNGQRYVCSLPRQLVRISEQNLFMYCENVTAEIDMCEFSGSSVRNVRFYNESSDGVPYYCSSDMSSFVTVSGKTLTFNSTVNHTLPLMSNESVYFGDCIQNGDNHIFFAFTTTIGNIYVVNPLQEDGGGVILKAKTQTFAQHQVYNENILYTNGSSTVLYNTSCQNDPHKIIIDHPYHLALHMLGEGTQSCSCLRQITDSTTEPGPGNNNDKTTTIIIVIATVLILVLVVVVILVLIFLNKGKHRPRPLEQQMISCKTVSSTSLAEDKDKKNDTFIAPTSSGAGIEKDRGDTEGGAGGTDGRGWGEREKKYGRKDSGGEKRVEEEGQSKEGGASIATVSSHTSGLILQSTTPIDLSLAQPSEGNATRTLATISQDEQLITSDCYQERDGKNNHDKSLVHTPNCHAINQYGSIPKSRQVRYEGREADLSSNQDSLPPCNDGLNSGNSENCPAFT